jgi:hypothetical protein
VIRAELDLPETEGGRVEKWPKQCMHMWINEQTNKQKITRVAGISHYTCSQMFLSAPFICVHTYMMRYSQQEILIAETYVSGLSFWKESST